MEVEISFQNDMLTVIQRIRILDATYTPDRIVEELEVGKLSTTMDFCFSPPCTPKIVGKKDKVVAEILSQEVNDLDPMDFEVEYDPNED